jgi:hypothetical protein
MIQAAIDRLMHTYGMLVNLSLDEELVARRKVTQFQAHQRPARRTSLPLKASSFFAAPLEPGVPDRNCKMCFATGWVGENRPERAWDEELVAMQSWMPCECVRSPRAARCVSCPDR